MQKPIQYKLNKPLYIKKNDKRYKEYTRQLKEHGFSDTETWNLDYLLVSFIIPRLKRFRDITPCYPNDLTPEKWKKIIDKMIFSFQFVLDEEDLQTRWASSKKIDKDYKKYEEGMNLFVKYFRGLWW